MKENEGIKIDLDQLVLDQEKEIITLKEKIEVLETRNIKLSQELATERKYRIKNETESECYQKILFDVLEKLVEK